MKATSVFVLAGGAALALAAVFFCAGRTPPAADGKLKIVATIFPAYDWTREIVGGTASETELTLLSDGGSDLHSYSPSVRDIAAISEADIFIYVGGESDGWVGDALAGAANADMIAINLLDALGARAKIEETVEGMQAAERHGGNARDEHVWLSLRNAVAFCEEIANALCLKDPANAETYRANCAAYTERLAGLDLRYAEAVASARRKTILCADRFPLRYLVDDYGLDYYAAFDGCSAESEASFKTVAFLAGKLDELGLESVVRLEDGNGKIAQTIVAGSKNKATQIVTFDSMQTAADRRIKKGETYVGAMERNLAALKAALD